VQPSPATPLAITTRGDLPWMLAAVRTGAGPRSGGGAPVRGASADVLAVLQARGACFRSELAGPSGRMPTEVDEGLWDLVSRGIVTADAFSAVRSLLAGRGGKPSGLRRLSTRRTSLGPKRALAGSGIGEGRWSLVPEPDDGSSGSVGAPAAEELAEAVAWQMLVRWGMVAWELWAHESYRIPWRDVVRALRRLEARGQALGGRFVAGMSGEQYALAEAAALLADVHRDGGRAVDVEVAGADPLNLTGELLGGPRTPAIRHRSVRYLDGVPVDPTPVASAG
jgi:ATP-dependent Lhr-like helicase